MFVLVLLLLSFGFIRLKLLNVLLLNPFVVLRLLTKQVRVKLLRLGRPLVIRRRFKRLSVLRRRFLLVRSFNGMKNRVKSLILILGVIFRASLKIFMVILFCLLVIFGTFKIRLLFLVIRRAVKSGRKNRLTSNFGTRLLLMRFIMFVVNCFRFEKIFLIVRRNRQSNRARELKCRPRLWLF